MTSPRASDATAVQLAALVMAARASLATIAHKAMASWREPRRVLLRAISELRGTRSIPLESEAGTSVARKRYAR